MEQKERLLDDALIIPVSKRKATFALLVGIVILWLVGWYCQVEMNENTFTSPGWYKPVLVVSVIVLLALLIFFTSLWRLISSKPALQFSCEGLLIFSMRRLPVFVPWKHVSQLSEITLGSQKMIILDVCKPENYQPSVGMTIEYRLCGTSVSVLSNTAAIHFSQLKDIMAYYVERYSN